MSHYSSQNWSNSREKNQKSRAWGRQAAWVNARSSLSAKAPSQRRSLVVKARGTSLHAMSAPPPPEVHRRAKTDSDAADRKPHAFAPARSISQRLSKYCSAATEAEAVDQASPARARVADLLASGAPSSRLCTVPLTNRARPSPSTAAPARAPSSRGLTPTTSPSRAPSST